jgi:NADH:ubiquinone oxidoreductase subunit 6 (subunit J)
VQVIVYAGAVMVLFLFVITLLGPVREQTTMRLPWQVFISAVVIAAFADAGGTKVTGSTYLFDQQVARFLATLAPLPLEVLDAGDR